MRLLGFARFISAMALAKYLLPMAIVGFVLAAPTGIALFVTEAPAIARNPVFQVKLALISLALLNAAAFHLGPWRNAVSWHLERPPPIRARLGAALSLPGFDFMGLEELREQCRKGMESAPVAGAARASDAPAAAGPGRFDRIATTAIYRADAVPVGADD